MATGQVSQVTSHILYKMKYVDDDHKLCYINSTGCQDMLIKKNVFFVTKTEEMLINLKDCV